MFARARAISREIKVLNKSGRLQLENYRILSKLRFQQRNEATGTSVFYYKIRTHNKTIAKGTALLAKQSEGSAYVF
jgi:hypothetical protein